jgi:ribonucleotide reductase alpha subunit
VFVDSPLRTVSYITGCRRGVATIKARFWRR